MSIKNPYNILTINPTTGIVSKNIKELEEETLNNLRNSKANNTLRAYKSDYENFALFCYKNNFQLNCVSFCFLEHKPKQVF